jgi:hypothetical protein
VYLHTQLLINDILPDESDPEVVEGPGPFLAYDVNRDLGIRDLLRDCVLGYRCGLEIRQTATQPEPPTSQPSSSTR